MWNQRFSEEGHAYGTEPNDYLKARASEIPADGEVLCLAEGQGRNAVWLAQQGFHVTAMDASTAGMASANALASERGVEIQFELGDLADYPVGESRWDGIALIWVPMSPDLRRVVLPACARGLKLGGILIYEGYGPRQPEYGTGGPSQPEMLPTLHEVRAELSGLHFLHAEEADRAVVEGKYHTGMSHVVQITARK